MKPTKETAIEINRLLNFGLTKGLGQRGEGTMCVEAAVCAALGEEHNDNPSCVSNTLRTIKISLNDSPYWTSNQSRAEGLRRVAVAQLGSIEIDNGNLLREYSLLIINRILPKIFRQVAELIPSHKIELNKHADICEKVDTAGAADAADAADAAAHAAARAAAGAADAADAAHAAAAARAAAYAATYASAVIYVDAAAAAAARAAARAAYAARAAAEEILCLSAECVVQALIKCNCEGTQWLDICNVAK